MDKCRQPGGYGELGFNSSNYELEQVLGLNPFNLCHIPNIATNPSSCFGSEEFSLIEDHWLLLLAPQVKQNDRYNNYGCDKEE